MKNPYGLHFKVQLAQMNSRVCNIASYLDRACLTSTDLGIYEGSGHNDLNFVLKERAQEAGLNIVFESRQVHAGLVFSKFDLFWLSFT